jgi:hypothetical protein
VEESQQHATQRSDDRIDSKSPEDVAAWAKELGVSAYHLRKIMTRVGAELKDIYYALGLRPWEIPKHGPKPYNGSTR